MKIESDCTYMDSQREQDGDFVLVTAVMRHSIQCDVYRADGSLKGTTYYPRGSFAARFQRVSEPAEESTVGA